MLEQDVPNDLYILRVCDDILRNDVRYCVMCLRTEDERKLKPCKALQTFLGYLSKDLVRVWRDWPLERLLTCYMCGALCAAGVRAAAGACAGLRAAGELRARASLPNHRRGGTAAARCGGELAALRRRTALVCARTQKLDCRPDQPVALPVAVAIPVALAPPAPIAPLAPIVTMAPPVATAPAPAMPRPMVEPIGVKAECLSDDDDCVITSPPPPTPPLPPLQLLSCFSAAAEGPAEASPDAGGGAGAGGDAGGGAGAGEGAVLAVRAHGGSGQYDFYTLVDTADGCRYPLGMRSRIAANRLDLTTTYAAPPPLLAGDHLLGYLAYAEGALPGPLCTPGPQPPPPPPSPHPQKQSSAPRKRARGAPAVVRATAAAATSCAAAPTSRAAAPMSRAAAATSRAAAATSPAACHEGAAGAGAARTSAASIDWEDKIPDHVVAFCS